MKIQAAISAAAGLLAFVLTPSFAHAAPTACDLLSAQTAASLAGSPVGNPIELQGASCTYRVTGKNTRVQVVFTAAPGKSGSDEIATYQRMASVGAHTETITGLGEQNLLVSIPHGEVKLNILMVVYRQKMLALSVERQITPEVKAAMIQAMKQMIAEV